MESIRLWLHVLKILLNLEECRVLCVLPHNIAAQSYAFVFERGNKDADSPLFSRYDKQQPPKKNPQKPHSPFLTPSVALVKAQPVFESWKSHSQRCYLGNYPHLTSFVIVFPLITMVLQPDRSNHKANSVC